VDGRALALRHGGSPCGGHPGAPARLAINRRVNRRGRHCRDIDPVGHATQIGQMGKLLDERHDLRLQLFEPVLRALPREIEDVRRVPGHRSVMISHFKSVAVMSVAVLAYAEPADLSASGWLLILECCGAILFVAALAIVPMAIAAHRRHQQREIVNTIAFMWGLIAAGSAVWLTIAEFNWKKEWQLRIMTGYLDPRDVTGAPRWPGTLWTILTIAYGALVVFTLVSGGRARSPAPGEPGEAPHAGGVNRG
jgi:hypothetical protein